MSAHIQHLTENNYAISQWSGGSTTQIAIAPDGAQYAERTFLWRISSATVELPESDFTPLPDYMRYISVLRGEMELTHSDKTDPVLLTPYGIHLFDGALETKSVGKCVDFNLMLRKGQCEGSLRAVQLPDDGTVTFSTRYEEERFPNNTLVVYCVEGAGKMTLDGQTLNLKSGESVVVEQSNQADGTLTCGHSAGFIIALINT